MVDLIFKLFNWCFDKREGMMSIDNIPRLVIVSLVMLGAFVVVFHLLADAIDKFYKFARSVRSKGFLIFPSEAAKATILKRQFLLRVIRSDLANLSTKESWNDQAFSELDAEVELDGAYYPDTLAKLTDTKLRGKRVVSSLTRAIGSASSKQCLLLGDAGSGKSVALRHFASAMAAAGVNSKEAEVFVPLYVNLREFDRTRYPELSPNSVKTFVIDNTRRDSHGTAEFIQTNWDEYCRNGCWYFLFDSFDEIPELLHASNDEEKRKEYADALLGFLASTGSCPAIIASREFKSPIVSGWDILRILPLSFRRKEQLVTQSLLTPRAKKNVLHFLGEYNGSLYDNPLFLTLLCRYVATHGRCPESDFNLLEDHIATLVRRDHEYINRSFQVSSEAALQAAINLAAVYAFNETIGLAPTRDEILNASSRALFDNRVDDFLAALVACKVLRRDVKDASAGSIRYAFSHRRYQETLFVRWVLANTETLSPTQFVKDRKWREYLVTMIQGKPQQILQPFLDALHKELSSSFENIAEQKFTARGLPPLRYILWQQSGVTYHLSVLLAGYAGKYGELREDIRSTISKRFEQIYNSGDIADQFIVIRNSSLCEDSTLSAWLREAVASQSAFLQGEAFQKAGAVVNPSSEFAQFVRRVYSAQVMLAHERKDVLRLEALVSRMSRSIGCECIFRRANLMRSLFGWLIQTSTLTTRSSEALKRTLGSGLRMLLGTGIEVIPAALIWLLLALVSACYTTPNIAREHFSYTAFFLAIPIQLVCLLLAMYLARDEPDQLTVSRLAQRIWGWIGSLKHSSAARTTGIFFAMLAIPSTVIYCAVFAMGYRPSVLAFYLVSFLILFICIVFLGIYLVRSDRRDMKDTLSAMLDHKKGDAFWVLLQADNPQQLLGWTLELDERKKLKNSTFRRMFTVLAGIETGDELVQSSPHAFIQTKPSSSSIKALKEQLLDVYLNGRSSRLTTTKRAKAA